MAKATTGAWGTGSYVPAQPKKTRQGSSKNTKIAATSRNSAGKRYKGQGMYLNKRYSAKYLKKSSAPCQLIGLDLRNTSVEGSKT